MFLLLRVMLVNCVCVRVFDNVFVCMTYCVGVCVCPCVFSRAWLFLLAVGCLCMKVFMNSCVYMFV